MVLLMSRSALRVERFDKLRFKPRFEYGHMAEVATTCTDADGTSLGTGFVRLVNAEIPWTICYDEVITVLEGELTLKANGEEYHLQIMDSIWLPNGTELVYQAEQALVSYAIYPNNW